MNIATLAYAEAFTPVLSADDAVSVRLLQAEITVLREARECVTPPANADVIYGRMDDLIRLRSEQMVGIFERAQGAALAEVHTRG